MMQSVPREMHHFLLMTHDEQRQAIQQLAAAGMNDHGIASATKFSVQMIRRLLAEHNDSEVRA